MKNEGALRDALLSYMRGVDDSSPTTGGPVATNWGHFAVIESAQSQLEGATGAAMR